MSEKTTKAIGSNADAKAAAGIEDRYNFLLQCIKHAEHFKVCMNLPTIHKE